MNCMNYTLLVENVYDWGYLRHKITFKSSNVKTIFNISNHATHFDQLSKRLSPV
jgi:hypothetical protein